MSILEVEKVKRKGRQVMLEKSQNLLEIDEI